MPNVDILIDAECLALLQADPTRKWDAEFAAQVNRQPDNEVEVALDKAAHVALLSGPGVDSLISVGVEVSDGTLEKIMHRPERNYGAMIKQIAKSPRPQTQEEVMAWMRETCYQRDLAKLSQDDQQRVAALAERMNALGEELDKVPAGEGKGFNDEMARCMYNWRTLLGRPAQIRIDGQIYSNGI